MFLIDDEYAEIMHDFEGKTFIVDRPNDLTADRPAELIALLDDTKFPKDLLGAVFDVVGVVMEQ